MSRSSKIQGPVIHTLTLGASTLLVVSTVIGSGVYKKVAPMSADLQSPVLVLFCWVLAGIISLFGALSNAEVAGMLAKVGGEYVYFNRIYGKFMGFIYGWSVFTVIKTSAVASISYVFSHSFNSIILLPRFSQAIENIQLFGIFKPFENFGVKSLTIILIIILSFINTRGLKGGSILSTSLTKLIIAGLTIVIVSGLLFGHGSLKNISTHATSYVSHPWYDFSVIKALFAAMLAAFWAFEGWNEIGYIGSEIQNPKKNIPLALSGGIAITIIVYLAVNFTYLYVLPADRFVKMYQTTNEIAAVEVVRHFAGNYGAILLSILILLTTLGCANSTLLMPPRIYYTMAKDGFFFRGTEKLHPRYNTPNRALWLQAVWASLLVLSGSFDQLTDMLVFAAFIYYGAIALGVIILRIREPEMERQYKVWGYPYVPGLFTLFCLALVIITFFTNPREASLGIALILTGVPFYLYWKRKLKTAQSK